MIEEKQKSAKEWLKEVSPGVYGIREKLKRHGNLNIVQSIMTSYANYLIEYTLDKPPLPESKEDCTHSHVTYIEKCLDCNKLLEE